MSDMLSLLVAETITAMAAEMTPPQMRAAASRLDNMGETHADRRFFQRTADALRVLADQTQAPPS